MGVTRDTSADAMAAALDAAAAAETPAQRAERRLWDARQALRETIEDLMRVATKHGQSPRVLWREREQTHAALTSGNRALLLLADLEREALSAAGDCAARSRPPAAGHKARGNNP